MQRYSVIVFLVLSYTSSVDFLVHNIIPTAKRCWHINHDSSEFSSRFIKEFVQDARHQIVTNVSRKSHTQSASVANRSDLTCDSYLFIRQNIEGIKNLPEDPDFMRMNNSVIVDTRLILAYEGSEDAFDKGILQFLNETLMNVIFIRISKKIDDSEKFLVKESGITKCYVVGPISGYTRIFIQYDLAKDSDLESLFRMQRWNPNTRAATFTIAHKDYYPFMRKTSAGGYEGFEYDIISGLSNNWKINFKDMSEFEGEYAEGNKWLTHAEIEQMLLYGAADLAIAGFCIPSSMDWNTVMRPYLDSCTSLLVPKPRPLDPSTYLYLPLKGLTWLCSAITFVMIICILNCLARFSGTSISRIPYRQLSYCFITLVNITCGHGVFFPKPSILRTILLIWMFATLMITTFYTTGYSSFLTRQSYSGKIKNLEDARQAGLRWTKMNDSDGNEYLLDMLRNSEDGSAQYRFADNADAFPDTQKEIAQRIRSSRYAQFARSLGGYFLTDLMYSGEDVGDILEVMEECLQYCPMTFLRAPRSPFRHVFYSRLSAALETGLISQWMERFVRKDSSRLGSNKMRAKEEASVKPLTVGNIRGAFYILLAGFFLATSCWLAEIFHHVR